MDAVREFRWKNLGLKCSEQGFGYLVYRTKLANKCSVIPSYTKSQLNAGRWRSPSATKEGGIKLGQKYITDVVVFTNSDYQQANDNLIKDRPSITNKISLQNDLWVGEIPYDESNIIMDSCEPKGLNFNPPRMYEQLYTFGRENAPDPIIWDSDKKLQLCIALSRIVHPTNVSFQYSAKIIKDDNMNLIEIIPGPINGTGSNAFNSVTGQNWLSESDGLELKNIVDLYFLNPLKEPISRALWYFEYASRLYELEVRWALISTGIESLIHTDKYSSTKQFYKRVPQLAKEVGITITEDEARDMYDLRSTLVHGQNPGSSSMILTLYQSMEKILREVIKKSIIDSKFAFLLEDKNNIKCKWPV